MRRVIVVLACLLFAASFSPAHAKSAFSGTYTVTGTNPTAGAYTGTLMIVPRGEIYDVQWWIGNQRYVGVGVVVNNTLSVAYSGAADRSWMGIAAYRQRADGSLDGRWAVMGSGDRTGTEIGTRK